MHHQHHQEDSKDSLIQQQVQHQQDLMEQHQHQQQEMHQQDDEVNILYMFSLFLIFNFLNMLYSFSCNKRLDYICIFVVTLISLVTSYVT